MYKRQEPDKAQALYEYMVEKVKERVPVVQTGTFGAMMKVSLINEEMCIRDRVGYGTGAAHY